jgi:molybdate transport system substrate-binding protein
VQQIRIVSAGAARGLLTALQGTLESRCGAGLEVSYGPVGVVSATLRSGADCDVVITSAGRLGELVDEGLVVAGSDASLGVGPTALAVLAGSAVPELSNGAALRKALLAADAVYCPDVERATAGIHLRSVLDRLGVAEQVTPRLSIHPHGAAALQAMVARSASSPVGIAQLTEVLATDGVVAVGSLPAPYDLATEYCAAVASQATDPARGAMLVRELCGPAQRDARRAAGFQ